MVSDPILEALSESSDMSEILWNFSLRKGNKNEERLLTLKQNPHFYEELPTSPMDYGDKFSMAPIESIETCLHERSIRRISILTDNLGEAGRVFLETGKKTRGFGNVCVLKNAVIFKGSWLSFLSHLISRLITSSQLLRFLWKT